MAKVDLSALAPQAATWVETAETNPAIAWLEESYAAKAARQIPVPASQAKDVVNMLNAAAKTANKGVQVRVVIGSDEHVPSKELWTAVEKLKDRQIVVKYRAKDRITRTRTATATATVTATAEPSATPAQ